MFSTGSIFTSLGARVLPEGFNQYARLVADAKAHRVADVRLGSMVEGSGFDRYARYIRIATGQTRDFSGVARESMGEADKAMAATGTAAERLASQMSTSLMGIRGEYLTVGEAAQHSAMMQEAAMAEMRGHLAETEAAAAGSATKMATEGERAGKSFSSKFGQAANLGRWATLGAGLTGVVSLKLASDFQKNMELIRTEAGGTQKNVQDLSKSVLNLAPSVGESPKALAEGLYHIASSGAAAAKEGLNTAKAMDILKVSAEGARIGNSNMEDVSNALVTTLKNSPKDIIGASDAMGVLVKTVGNGNLRMRDLVAAFSSGLPATGKALGLGMRDIAAALDVMTSRGVPAQQAANRLRTTLSLMEDPTSKASKALAQVGIAHDTVAKAFQSGGIVGGLKAVQEGLDRTFPKGRALTQDEYTAAIKRYNTQLDALGVTGAARDKDMAQFKARLQDVGTAATEQAKTIFDAFGGARMGTTMQILMQNVDDVNKHFQDLSKGGAKGATDSLNSAWSAYQKTFAFQMQQLWADIQRIGIGIGDFLIPKVEALVHGLEDVGHFLGQHKTLLAGLEILIGVGLTGAILAFVQKTAIGFKESMKQLGAYMTQWDKLKGTSKSTSESIVADNAAQAESIDKVTASLVAEAEQLGVVQAEMGKLALTGEAVTAGSLVVPGMPYSSRKAGGAPGSLYSATSTGRRAMTLEESLLADATMAGGGGLAAEEGALAAGEGALARSPGFFGRMGSGIGGMKGVMGRVGPGLMLGVGGTMVSQLAGSVIGGSAGHDVSKIGSWASTGAGLGMLIGPEGAIAGGVIGGLAGAFSSFLGGHKAADYGKQIAKQFDTGMGTLHLNVSPPTQQHVDSVMKTAGEAIQKAQSKLAPTRVVEISGPHAGASIIPSIMSEAEKRKLEAEIQSEYDKIGRAAAQAFDEGMKNGPKWQTSGTFFHSMVSALNSLPTQSRTAAARAMLVTATELEDQGRLPHGAVTKLVDDLARQFGTLGPQLQKQARQAMELINTELQQNKVVQTTQGLVDNINKTFADAPPVAKVNAQNVRKVWEQEMDFLKSHLHDKNQATAADAQSAWQAIHSESVHYAKLMNRDVGGAIDDLAGRVSGDLGSMAGAANSAAAAVGDSVKSVAKQVNDMATSLGAKGIKFTPAKTPAAQHTQLNVFGPKLPNFSQAGGNLLPGQATGGIPHPGSGPSDDHVLVSPDGTPVAVMSGTEGVLNSPQMGITDVALRIANVVAPEAVPYKGLDHMWGSGLRHYDQGGVLSRANSLDRMHLPYIWGGHHGDSGPIGNPRPGLDCSSTVSYVLGIPPRVSGAFGDFGKPGPGAITVYYNPTHTFLRILGRYFGTSGFGHPKAGGGPAWFTTDPSPSYLKNFQTRHVDASWAGMGNLNPGTITGTGDLADIARAAQHREVDQANSWINTLLSKLDSASGQPLVDSSGTPAAPGQAKAWIRQAMGIAHVSGPLWENMLTRQAYRESSFNPTSVNTTDINAQHGDPSKGFLQLTGSNFATYSVPGHKNILNPVDNTIASIRYIISTYGGGNASRAAQVMWNRGGGAYAMGGLLRRFQGGGSFRSSGGSGQTNLPQGVHIKSPTRNPNRRIETGPHGLHPATGGTGSKGTHKAPQARKGPQVLPHSILKTIKLTDITGAGGDGTEGGTFGQIDEADKEIKAEDTKYGEDERYFNIVDASLTDSDLGTLKDLRHTQFTQLQSEQTLDEQAGTELTGLGHMNTLHQAWIKKEAQNTLNKINATKRALVLEGRRLAKLRHHRADKVLAMADQLASKVASLADKRSALNKRKKSVQDSYDRRISDLSARGPGKIDDQLKAIDKHYQPLMDSANQHQGKNAHDAVKRQRDAAKQTLRDSHNRALAAHQGQMRGLRAQRKAAIAPIDKELVKVGDDSRHLRVDEAHHRRMYQKQGWDQAWRMTTQKYKLQDRLKNLQDTEKYLTGSTTEIGTGGYLKTLVDEGTGIKTAQTTLAEKAATIPSDIVDSALNQLDLAGQQAQANANSTNQATDIFGYIPQDILGTLQGAGIAGSEVHRVYQPSGTTVDASGNVVDTPTGAGSVADVAQQALLQIASMDAASSQIYQQFGSNVVAPGALGAMLRSSGQFGPGVTYFGAEGPAFNAAMGLSGAGTPVGSSAPRTENNFYQNNTYTTAPQDPHLYAQASRVQFENAFG